MTTEQFSRFILFLIVGTLSAIILSTIAAAAYGLVIKPLINM